MKKDERIKDMKRTIKALRKENKQLKSKIQADTMINEINTEFKIKAIEEYYDYLAQEDKSAGFAINFQSYKNKLKNKKIWGTTPYF